MNSSENCKKTLSLAQRHSLRGLKRCPRCGSIHAQRALVCNNERCELRKEILANRRPFDPVQLVSHSRHNLWYSLRCKQKNVQRSFVHITEENLELENGTHNLQLPQYQNCENSASAIVSRNATCFVDSCAYGESTGYMPCKHIEVCTSDSADSTIARAEVYTITREVLWNLNISKEQKQRLWNLYKDQEKQVPAVQRINALTFAVSCEVSKVFPAHRLHVTALSNTLTSKKGTHSCACKKLKIIVEPDNSVVMKEEVCDHILLVLAAVLSKSNGKTVYGNFTNALKSFWMPAALEIPVVDASHDDDAFFGLSINIGGNFGKHESGEQVDDIFIYGNEFDDNIPDFSDIILDLTPADTPPTSQSLLPIYNSSSTTSAASTNNTATSLTSDLLHPGDPNLVSSCSIIEEDIDIQFHDVTSATTIATAPPILPDANTTTHLELSDCNIELMDQFQLTDQIDLCSDDITLAQPTPEELFESNSISILTPSLPMQHVPVSHSLAITTIDSSSTLTRVPTITTQSLLSVNQEYRNDQQQFFYNSNTSLLKRNQTQLLHPELERSNTTALPPIELPTIAVVKKEPVKASAIVAEVKTRMFPHIPAKRALIVNGEVGVSGAVTAGGVDEGANEHKTTEQQEPSLAYSAWLDYIIETLNESVNIVEKTEVAHTFHVHEEIFSHFSKSFSKGIKRRIPNATTVVKIGKHKGLFKYTWYFTTASTVQRIFSTKNISLQIERSFECNNEGAFVPYVRRVYDNNSANSKQKRVYPKLSLYIAHIWFDCSNSNHKTGIKLEWLPNAFPKSHFGILTIEFSLGIRDPHNIQL